MTAIGEMSLWVALLMAGWSTVASAVAAVGERDDLAESGRRALGAALVMLLLAAAGLWTALVTHDFTRTYVVAHSSANQPLVYTVAAFWAGTGGSVLSWATAWNVFAVIAVRADARSPFGTARTAAIVSMLLLVALAVACLGANPFSQLEFVVTDGRGLAAPLQNMGFVLLPPLEAFAYAAVMALVVWNDDDRIRPWARLASLLLSLALLVRVWWTYTTLESGRFWRWELGESATLVLWLVVGGMVHHRRTTRLERSRRADPYLVSLAFLLALSGVVWGGTSSLGVGQFPDDLSSRLSLGAGFVVALLTALSLSRRGGAPAPNESHTAARSLPIGVTASSIGAFVLIGLAVAVAFAVLYPYVDAWVEGTATAGSTIADTSMTIAAPLLLAVFAAAPLAVPAHTWPSRLRAAALPLVVAAVGTVGLVLTGITSVYVLATAAVGMFAIAIIVLDAGGRRPGALGREVTHVGVVALVVGLCAASLTTQREVTVRAGETIETHDPFGHRWKLVGQGVSLYDVLNRRVVAVTLEAFREGTSRGLVRTEKRQVVDARNEPVGEPVTAVGVLRTASLDVRTELADASGEVARVRISFVPLVALVWLGGLLVVVGGLLDLTVRGGGD